MSYFVGVDWASAEHAVCVITDRAQIVWRGTVPHTATGLAELRARLTRLAPPATLPVAVERPSGLLIDTHIHLFDPERFPYAPNATYKPPAQPLDRELGQRGTARPDQRRGRGQEGSRGDVEQGF